MDNINQLKSKVQNKENPQNWIEIAASIKEAAEETGKDPLSPYRKAITENYEKAIRRTDKKGDGGSQKIKLAKLEVTISPK